MRNYATGYEYTGKNAEILAATGSESVVTFKQAVRDIGVSGKKMKGIKAVASLFRFSKDVDDEGNRKIVWYSVFDANQVLARK